MASLQGTRRIVAACAVVGVLGQGCAFIDPHPHNDGLIRPFGDVSTEQTKSATKQTESDRKPIPFAGDLAQAMEDVAEQRKDYLWYADQHSILRNVAPLGVAGLVASSLFLSITGHGSTEIFAILGGSSAALAGGTAFYTSKPRQELYYRAAQGLGCLMIAYRPLLVPQSEYDVVGSEIAILQERIESVRAAIGQAEGTTGLDGEELAAITLAKRDLERALGIVAKGQGYKRSVETSGFMLRQQAQALVEAVDIEIVKSEPDPSSITLFADSLKPATSRFVAAFGPASAQGTGIGLQSESVNQQEQVIDKLQQAVILMNQQADRVVPFLDEAAGLDALIAEAKECEAPTLPGERLDVYPSDDVVSVSGETTLNYRIFADGIPNALVAKGASDQIERTGNIEIVNGAYSAEFKVKSGFKGPATIIFTTQTGRTTKSIEVVKTGTTQTPPKPNNGPQTGGNETGTNTPATGGGESSKIELTEFEQKLEPHQVRFVQREIGFTDTSELDGEIGPKTRKKAQDFAASRPEYGTIETVTEEFYKKLSNNHKERIKNVTSYSAAESAKEITDYDPAQHLSLETSPIYQIGSFLVEKGCMTEDQRGPKMSSAYRVAIWEFQDAADIPMTGFIGGETNKLLSSKNEISCS